MRKSDIPLTPLEQEKLNNITLQSEYDTLAEKNTKMETMMEEVLKRLDKADGPKKVVVKKQGKVKKTIAREKEKKETSGTSS